MNDGVSNVAASVHARLLNRAKSEGRPFNELLQYYAMERFLYRLSRSDHRDQFVLKGALMLQFWGGALVRATKDIDLLGRETVSVPELIEVVRSCLRTEVPEDGVRFHPESVVGEEIRIDAHYDGVRVRCSGSLGNARLHLQIDVGFGDVITPGTSSLVYPTLLDFEAPRLLGYTPETAIAEKLEAMVVLDRANSRLKDFLDIWVLSRKQQFVGEILSTAIGATFARRRTPIPADVPFALSPAFASDAAKQVQWRAYVRKARVQGPAVVLDEVVGEIRDFLMPVLTSLAKGQPFDAHWPEGGPWTGTSGEDAEHAHP